jgi:hypothetical protein
MDVIERRSKISDALEQYLHLRDEWWEGTGAQQAAVEKRLKACSDLILNLAIGYSPGPAPELFAELHPQGADAMGVMARRLAQVEDRLAKLDATLRRLDKAPPAADLQSEQTYWEKMQDWHLGDDGSLRMEDDGAPPTPERPSAAKHLDDLRQLILELDVVADSEGRSGAAYRANMFRRAITALKYYGGIQ